MGFGSNIGGTVLKVVIADPVTTMVKIAGNCASLTFKVAGDTASTGMKIVGDSIGTLVKVGSDTMGTANKIANDAADTLLRTDITSIPSKVIRDGLATGDKILTDTTGTLVKVAGDVDGTVEKVVSNSSNSVSKFGNDTISTMDKFVLDAETTVIKVVDDTVTATVHAANHVLSSRAADALLRYATNVFAAAGDAAVIDAILQVTRRSLEALTQSLSGAALIWRGIFSNETNPDSLRFILNHLDVLLWFLYDLGRPDTVISRYPAADGVVDGDNNPYNELDLRRQKNRHAVIYQVQRVALTLIAILKIGREQGLDDLQMNVRLRSDFDEDGNPPPRTYVSSLKRPSELPPTEKWLFINGIANEFAWFQYSCDKIRDTFEREVKGIYNRSDGILWDLIECCGEHSGTNPNPLIKRTPSSKAAQKVLEEELRNTLWPVDGSDPGKVVMIAHSQGCLLLRLVLQKLVSENHNSQKEREMNEG